MKKSEIYLLAFIGVVILAILYSNGMLFSVYGSVAPKWLGWQYFGSNCDGHIEYTCLLQTVGPNQVDGCALSVNYQGDNPQKFIYPGETYSADYGPCSVENKFYWSAYTLHYCGNGVCDGDSYGESCMNCADCGSCPTTTTTTTIPFWEQTYIDSIPNWLSLTVGGLFVALAFLLYRKKLK